MTASIFGHLEVDCERGTVYFHSTPVAQSITKCHPIPLRIHGLDKIPFPFKNKQINITVDQASHESVVEISK